MIIICPSCKKKFEIDENLIPEKGRLLKCGSCTETWFYNKNDQLNLETSSKNKDVEIKTKDEQSESFLTENKSVSENLPDFTNNKGTELVKYKPKSTFTFGKILSYLIVFIISFIAVIIILDTFKAPLSIFFPNLELILYNLFETLRDLVLFVKDLN